MDFNYCCDFVVHFNAASDLCLEQIDQALAFVGYPRMADQNYVVQLANGTRLRPSKFDSAIGLTAALDQRNKIVASENSEMFSEFKLAFSLMPQNLKERLKKNGRTDEEFLSDVSKLNKREIYKIIFSGYGLVSSRVLELRDRVSLLPRKIWSAELTLESCSLTSTCLPSISQQLKAVINDSKQAIQDLSRKTFEIIEARSRFTGIVYTDHDFSGSLFYPKIVQVGKYADDLDIQTWQSCNREFLKTATGRKMDATSKFLSNLELYCREYQSADKDECQKQREEGSPNLGELCYQTTALRII